MNNQELLYAHVRQVKNFANVPVNLSLYHNQIQKTINFLQIRKFPTRKSRAVHVADAESDIRHSELQARNLPKFGHFKAAEFPKSCDFGYGNSIIVTTNSLEIVNRF